MNEQWCKRNGIFRHLFMRWVLAHAPLTKRLNSVITMQVPDSIKKDKRQGEIFQLGWPVACCNHAEEPSWSGRRASSVGRRFSTALVAKWRRKWDEALWSVLQFCKAFDCTDWATARPLLRKAGVPAGVVRALLEERVGFLLERVSLSVARYCCK